MDTLLTNISNTSNTNDKFLLMALHRDDILLHTAKTSKQDTATILKLNYTQFTQWIRHTQPYSNIPIDIVKAFNNESTTRVVDNERLDNE